MSERVSVYSTNKAFEAEMISQFLKDNNIMAFTFNKMDSSYHFGEIEIFVIPEDVIRAKKLIEDYHTK